MPAERSHYFNLGATLARTHTQLFADHQAAEDVATMRTLDQLLAGLHAITITKRPDGRYEGVITKHDSFHSIQQANQTIGEWLFQGLSNMPGTECMCEHVAAVRHEPACPQYTTPGDAK